MCLGYLPRTGCQWTRECYASPAGQTLWEEEDAQCTTTYAGSQRLGVHELWRVVLPIVRCEQRLVPNLSHAII